MHRLAPACSDAAASSWAQTAVRGVGAGRPLAAVFGLLALGACGEQWKAPLLTVTPVDMEGSAGDGAVGVVRPHRLVAFGAELAPGKLSPALEYYTVPGATVRACAMGTVRRILLQGTEDGGVGEDFEVHVEPQANSPWLVIYDHVRAPRVRKGQRVEAGDPLGEVGRFSDSLGRVELQVNHEREGVAHCPLRFGSPRFQERHEALLLAARAHDTRVTTLCLRPTVAR